MQQLIVDGDFANESLRTVLSSCPNITDLAIHHEFTPYGTAKWTYYYLLPIVQEIPHLKRLTVGSLSLLSYYRESLVRNLLNLTHLSIHGSLIRSWEEWDVLTRLPKLTHLNMECVTQEHIPKLLLLCPLLKLLVLYHCCICRTGADAYYWVNDNRLLLLQKQPYDEWILNWERGANGAVDSWIFSERVVFARESEYLFGFSSTY